MPYYRKCSKSVAEMAKSILRQYPSHQPLIDAGVTIDFVFAFPDLDEQGNPVNDALTKGGVKALGLAKIIPADRRAKGESDCEVKLDAPHWDSIDVEQQEALLDHELNHFSVVVEGENTDGETVFKKDSNGRPKLRMRKHDREFGWFRIIAERHGANSQERIQAAEIMAVDGQYFWPEIVNQLKAKSDHGSRTQKLELEEA